MDFEQKFDFLKTHKNSYMRPLCITDLQYGDDNKEIRSFYQFLPQTGDFGLNRRLTPMDFFSKFCQKSIGVSLRFYRKSSVYGKN
jgi:hypothetical protein